MPEEKIGTKVELDITNYLSGLAKLGTAWDKYLDVLEQTYPTSEKINKTLKVTTDRMKELRHSTEKLSEVEKAELAVLKKRAAGLKDIVDSYKKLSAAEKAGAAETARATAETERATRAATDTIAAAHMRQQKAVEDTARKQEQAARKAEQAQRAQQRAAERTTRAQERQTGSVKRNLKQMLLWGIGAASAYRMFMKIRRALQETFGELYGNTEAYKTLTAATNQFKISLLSVLGTENEVLALLERSAAGLRTLADGFNQTIAAIRGFVAGTIMLLGDLTDVEGKTKAAAHALDVYNAVMESYREQVTEAATETGELTARQKEAAQAYERYQQRLYRITENRLRGLLRAHRAYYDALADMALEDTRRAEDLAIDTARRREDWARDAARRRAALLRQYNEQALRVERNYNRAVRRLADDRARRLLQIERRYQDRLLEIERSYSRSMYEAIATRDATAALRAMRQRREDLADAKRDRDRARSDVEADYLRRLRDLRENLEEQRRQARRSYEEALEELNRSLREQEEDLALSLKRREEDAALSRQRQLQDLMTGLADQMKAVTNQYKMDRRLAEIEYRYREDAFAAHLARMQAIAQAYQAAFRPPQSPAVGGGGTQRFAEGGAMVVTKPTLALFGEGGRPELVIAQPLPPASQSFMVSGSVRHEVSTIIQQSMAGFEGRIAGAVHSALAEVIR